MEVSVDALPNQAFKAVLDAVDPLVDANGRAISLRARLDNPELKLRPGMSVVIDNKLALDAKLAPKPKNT